MGGVSRKLPSREEVARLYVEEHLSTTMIARMFDCCENSVRLQLIRHGVMLRNVGVGWTGACIEPGCGKPVVRVWHAKLKSWYGRRCETHQREHRKKVCYDFGKRDRAKRPEILKQRYDEWYNRLKLLSDEELLQEIKEKPCRTNKAVLLRKMRQLLRTGHAQEAINLALKAYPTLAPGRA
jgi:hypothetical protein